MFAIDDNKILSSQSVFILQFELRTSFSFYIEQG